MYNTMSKYAAPLFPVSPPMGILSHIKNKHITDKETKLITYLLYMFFIFTYICCCCCFSAIQITIYLIYIYIYV